MSDTALANPAYLSSILPVFTADAPLLKKLRLSHQIDTISEPTAWNHLIEFASLILPELESYSAVNIQDTLGLSLQQKLLIRRLELNRI